MHGPQSGTELKILSLSFIAPREWTKYSRPAPEVRYMIQSSFRASRRDPRFREEARPGIFDPPLCPLANFVGDGRDRPLQVAVLDARFRGHDEFGRPNWSADS